MFRRLFDNLKKAYNRLKLTFRRSSMPPINPRKVAAFLATLNGVGGILPAAAPQWVEVQGTNALMKMDINPVNGTVIYNPGIGFPVKGFINLQTGEIKLYNARIFTGE